MEFVVTETNNYNNEGKVILCKTEEEGKKKLLELYIAKVNETSPLNEEDTYVEGEGLYGRVSDYLRGWEYRVLKVG